MSSTTRNFTYLVPLLALVTAPGCATGMEVCMGIDCLSLESDTDGPEAGEGTTGESWDSTSAGMETGPVETSDDGGTSNDAGDGGDVTTGDATAGEATTGDTTSGDTTTGGTDGGDPAGSCESRCGATYDATAPCQCDGECFAAGDCCEDIQIECPWICGSDEQCGGTDICVDYECNSPYGYEWTMTVVAVEGLDCIDGFGNLELEYLAWLDDTKVADSPISPFPGWPTYEPYIGVVWEDSEFQIDFWEVDTFFDDYKDTFCWAGAEEGQCGTIPAQVLHDGEYIGVWSGGPMIRIEFGRVQ